MSAPLPIHARPPEEDWPPLVPLEAPTLPRMDRTALPGWAGDYARALAAATEVPFELSAGLVLAACSTAAARRLRVRVGPDHFEPCNLWIAVPLPPGNRKSANQTAATAPLLEWEREQGREMEPEIKRIASEVATMEARVRELRGRSAKKGDREAAAEAAEIEADMPEVPRPPQLWTSDATPERLGTLLADNGESLAWLSSEGGIFDLLGGRYSHGIPNLDLVLKAWSGDPERVDRGGRPRVYLRHPLLTIGLAPQPDVLRGLATRPGFRGRGLLGRFLYLLPPSPLGFRTFEPAPIPGGIGAAYSEGLRAMLEWMPAITEDGEESPRIVQMSPGARAAWLEFARTVEALMRSGAEFEHATDWAGKAPGQAARLAGILHGIEHAHGEPWGTPITAETMAAALDLMAVFARHSLAALELMGADPSVTAAARVWEWVTRGCRTVFTLREAHQALRSTFPRAADLREALEILEERGYLEIGTPDPGPGRPSPFARVRPDIARAWG